VKRLGDARIVRRRRHRSAPGRDRRHIAGTRARTGGAASKSVGRPTKASAARPARQGRQRHLRHLSLVRHLRGFAPVGGGGEHAGRPRQAAPSPPPTTTGPMPPGTYLRTVVERLLDDRSRRKRRQTTATIATMKCYFPCWRRLIIIFSHQEDAPTGRAGPGRAAGAAGPAAAAGRGAAAWDGADWLVGPARPAWLCGSAGLAERALPLPPCWPLPYSRLPLPLRVARRARPGRL